MARKVQEVRLQEGRLQGVPDYQQVEEVRQAHRSWAGEREVHPGVHRLDRWGGKEGHPGGKEALNMQAHISTKRLLPNLEK